MTFDPAKFTSSWREESLARVCELEILVCSMRDKENITDEKLLRGAEKELGRVREALEQRGLLRRLNGSAVQRVHAHLDAAEVFVLRAAPAEYVNGQTAALVSYIRQHLVPSDPRCVDLDLALEAERMSAHTAPAARTSTPPPQPPYKEQLISAVHGAMAEARNEQMRLRSFRNLLLLSALVLLLLAAGLCVLGSITPEKLPVCFQPTKVEPGATKSTSLVVCPTDQSPLPSPEKLDTVMVGTVNAWDVPLIELLGLVAGAVASATALRKVRGTSTPYSLPATLAFLKLALGTLTALLGLLLLSGEFVPGLSALDSSAQIIAWAVIFGYSQQAFTHVVDRKAQSLLEDVGGAEQRERHKAASQRPLTPKPPPPAKPGRWQRVRRWMGTPLKALMRR
ncbi:hypothetical protein ACGFNU_36590 [Spirillospora sp. NPDC048911]|uniref:hypothetical protein n=1 Tax=Spirillospora sp. NPDC048911 TaxID=3364527 RepID=UPI0037207EE4